MKRVFLSICIASSFVFPVSALEISTGTSSETTGIFSTLEKINKEKTALSELEGQVNFEKQKISTQSSAIDSLDELHNSVSNQEKELEILEDSFSGSASIPPEILTVLEDKKANFWKTIVEYFALLQYEASTTTPDYSYYKQNKKELEKKYSEVLKALSTDIIDAERFLVWSQSKLKDMEESLNKSQIALQIQIKEMVTKMIIFVTLFCIFYFSSKLIQKSIKTKDSFTEEKKQVLLSIAKWTKNALLFSLLVFFFFSEFLTILPFLAILGTALWLALRDVISSFIAWFVIGLKDSIYSAGDVIEIEEENVFWRIIKISPLITVIQELWLSGPNGMYRSFPNKIIFERSVKNISKQKGWIFITTDFLLSAKSDIVLAKKLLMETMNEVVSQSQKFTQAPAHKWFLKKFGHTEETLKPQVFMEIRPQGVLLRGKIPVLWGERHLLRTEVVESFVEKTRKRKMIDFRYVEIGGNFFSGKN